MHKRILFSSRFNLRRTEFSEPDMQRLFHRSIIFMARIAARLSSQTYACGMHKKNGYRRSDRRALYPAHIHRCKTAMRIQRVRSSCGPVKMQNEAKGGLYRSLTCTRHSAAHTCSIYNLITMNSIRLAKFQSHFIIYTSRVLFSNKISILIYFKFLMRNISSHLIIFISR